MTLFANIMNKNKKIKIKAFLTISRKLFTLTIEKTDGIKEYSIPIDAYPFLRNLRVLDEVTIKKDTRTEELFVSWPWAGYEIPLSEFKINM